MLSTAVLLDLDQLARGGLDEGLRLHPLGAVLLPMGNEQLPQVLNLVLQMIELVLHPKNNLYARQIDPISRVRYKIRRSRVISWCE